MKRKVYMTALGAITGTGRNMDQVWRAMFARHQPHDKIRNFQIDDSKYAKSCATRKEGLIDIACGVPLTTEELAAELKEQKPGRFDRHQLLALLAANEVMDKVEGVIHVCPPERFGIIGGTGNGGLAETYSATVKLEAGDPLDAFANIRELPNPFVAHIANRYGMRGPVAVHVTACAASAHALQDAVRHIRLGEADAILVVGVEAVITPFGIASFARQQALSKKSRVFQEDRLGFLMGEGAVAILVESEENVRRRSVTPLAEIAGYGSTTDGNPDGAITAPDPKGEARAAELALEMAGIEPKNIACIVAHATGTPDGDRAELGSTKLWAGEWAQKIPIFAPKSGPGHLLGAAGALGAATSCRVLLTRSCPPTWGLTPKNVDPELAEFDHVMGEPREIADGYVLSNSFGFGGANASIIFKRP